MLGRRSQLCTEVRAGDQCTFMLEHSVNLAWNPAREDKGEVLIRSTRACSSSPCSHETSFCAGEGAPSATLLNEFIDATFQERLGHWSAEVSRSLIENCKLFLLIVLSPRA